MSQKIIRPFHIFKKSFETLFKKVIDSTQQLQVYVRENVVGFEKALRAVKVIKYQIQYRSKSLLNLALGYFSDVFVLEPLACFTSESIHICNTYLNKKIADIHYSIYFG